MTHSPDKFHPMFSVVNILNVNNIKNGSFSFMCPVTRFAVGILCNRCFSLYEFRKELNEFVFGNCKRFISIDD